MCWSWRANQNSIKYYPPENRVSRPLRVRLHSLNSLPNVAGPLRKVSLAWVKRALPFLQQGIILLFAAIAFCLCWAVAAVPGLMCISSCMLVLMTGFFFVNNIHNCLWPSMRSVVAFCSGAEWCQSAQLPFTINSIEKQFCVDIQFWL